MVNMLYFAELLFDSLASQQVPYIALVFQKLFLCDNLEFKSAEVFIVWHSRMPTSESISSSNFVWEWDISLDPSHFNAQEMSVVNNN